MKTLFSLLALTLSLNAFATEWLRYYVYVETEYVQGPWTRADRVEASEYKYLTVEAYEDLFGSGDAQLVEKLLSRLKAKKPGVYNWKYNLAFRGDTVLIRPEAPVKNRETVKNEITATLTFNGFRAVTFNFGDHSETLTGKDLTLPYFDLVSMPEKPAPDTVKPRETVQQGPPLAGTAEKKNPLTNWLILSLLLNAGLAGFLTLKMIRK